MPESLVTPSTSLATSSPNSSRTSSSDALVSSTVSCRSAAQSVAVSSRMPAQILATPTGCTMKSSPLARRWSAWRSQANTNAFVDELAVDCLDGVGGVLLDHGEQVAEQHALVVGEVGLRNGGDGLVVLVDRVMLEVRRRRASVSGARGGRLRPALRAWVPVRARRLGHHHRV